MTRMRLSAPTSGPPGIRSSDPRIIMRCALCSEPTDLPRMVYVSALGDEVKRPQCQDMMNFTDLASAVFDVLTSGGAWRLSSPFRGVATLAGYASP